MTIQTMVLGFICLLLLAGVAYGVGRRVGVHLGRRQALNAAPLLLRTRALQTGNCPICDGEIVK